MGYYIQTDQSHNKAQQICDMCQEAFVIPQPSSFDKVPKDMALICVVDNGPFEAAGYCYDEREFIAWCDPSDTRPKTWLLMSKIRAEELTGYGRRKSNI